MKLDNNFLTNNLALKISALLCAIIIWIIASIQIGQVGSFPQALPIEIHNLPAGKTAQLDNTTVKLKIVADQATWKGLSNQSFTVFVDAKENESGTYDLPISVALNKKNVQLVDVNPNHVIVAIEDSSNQEHSLEPIISGQPAAGYQVGNVKFTPEKVKLSGSAVGLGKIGLVAAVVNVDNLSANAQKSVKVIVFDRSQLPLGIFEITPSEVQADITIHK